jgi:hypothetical protein
MSKNRAILAPIEREIFRAARRMWVKDRMFLDSKPDNLDLDLDILFFATKASPSEAICDGQRTLRAYRSEDGLSLPCLDYCDRISNSRDARPVSKFTFLTYESARSVNLGANAGFQTFVSSFEASGLVEGYKEKLDLGNQRKFWSFFDDLRGVEKGALRLRNELSPGNLFLGPEHSRYHSNIDYQFHISSDDIQSLWIEVAESDINFYSSCYDFEAALRSAFEQRIWKIARVRARVRFCLLTVQVIDPNNVREQIFGFVIHTGNSPPCSGAQLKTLVRSQLEDGHVAIWKFNYTKDISRTQCKGCTRRCRDARSSSTRRSRGNYKSRRGSFRWTRAYREAATLEAATLLYPRVGQVVDKLQLAA